MSRFKCPKCGGTKLRVTKTDSRPEDVFRLRICSTCHLRLETTEIIETIYERKTQMGQSAKRFTPDEFAKRNDK